MHQILEAWPGLPKKFRNGTETSIDYSRPVAWPSHHLPVSVEAKIEEGVESEKLSSLDIYRIWKIELTWYIYIYIFFFRKKFLQFLFAWKPRRPAETRSAAHDSNVGHPQLQDVGLEPSEEAVLECFWNSERFAPSLATLRFCWHLQVLDLLTCLWSCRCWWVPMRVVPPSEVASFRCPSGLDAQDVCWYARKRSQLPQPPATLLAASMPCFIE